MSEKNISGITKIAVKGFKSIAEECEIDIRPLLVQIVQGNPVSCSHS